jgi:Tfp pilus assembly protein PilO
MDLKNITVEDLKEKFAAFDKKTLIKFGIGIGAIILFLIIYFAILRPMVNEKKATLDDQINKEMEIQKFENDIVTIKKRIKKMEPIVEKNSTLFHSKAEVEGLYDSLSRFAGAYGLVISKIQKQKPQPILNSGVAAQAEELLDQSMVSYYKIPVDYEIKGNFLNYIKFKRAVSRSKKMLNFDKELINVVQNDPNGAVVASGELTIVGLPNEFF